MKAVVFAAGLGTRMGEFTKSHPKALVEVGGRTMLERVLVRLRESGVREVVVNVHHFAEQIIEYLRANDSFGLDLHVSHERELLLETGGGILAAGAWLGGNEPVIVHNADILTDFPLDEMVAAHRSTGADATLLVAGRETSRYLLFDRDGRMHGWTNVATGAVRPDGFRPDSDMAFRAFGAVHVIEPSLLDAMKAYNDNLVARGAEADSRGICRFSIMDFYIDNCSRCGFTAYEPSHPYLWCDIGKPDSLARAQAMLSQVS